MGTAVGVGSGVGARVCIASHCKLNTGVSHLKPVKTESSQIRMRIASQPSNNTKGKYYASDRAVATVMR